MNHYPDKAKSIAENGGYDLACYGHNHQLSVSERIGDTLMINPGCLMGYHGGKLEDISATFVLLDLQTMKPEIQKV